MKGKQLILNERQRQISAEGWSETHDDSHNRQQMMKAGDCYFNFADANEYDKVNIVPRSWPWDLKWWKPKDQLKDYIRAGALYLAEMERLKRRGLKDMATYVKVKLMKIECEIRIDNIVD